MKKSAESIEINLKFYLKRSELEMALRKGIYQALESFSKIATNNEDVNSLRTKPIRLTTHS